MKIFMFFLALATAALFVGCTYVEHLRPDQGKQFRLFFARQQVFPEAATGNPMGLDSEEAAVIHAKYNKQMSEGTRAPATVQPQMLLLKEPKR